MLRGARLPSACLGPSGAVRQARAVQADPPAGLCPDTAAKPAARLTGRPVREAGGIPLEAEVTAPRISARAFPDSNRIRPPPAPPPLARPPEQVTTFQQTNDFLGVPDTAPAIVPPEYVPQEDLTSWLLDERARDQYALRWADNTEIFWNEPGQEKLEPE